MDLGMKIFGLFWLEMLKSGIGGLGELLVLFGLMQTGIGLIGDGKTQTFALAYYWKMGRS